MKRWQWVVLIQATALMIGIVMPVTPSKTGSDWSMAELVFAEPSYVQEVLVYFVLTNLLVLVVGTALFVAVRRDEGRGN